MYVVKKCDNHSYGQNHWYEVHVTADREDAISFAREEYRLTLSSDPNLSSDDIEHRLNSAWGVPQPGGTIYARKEFGHDGVRFAIMQSDSTKYDQYRGLMRPTRTEALDAILGSK